MRAYPIRQKDPQTSRVLSFDFTEHLPSGVSLTGVPEIQAEGLTVVAVVESPWVRARLTGGADGADIRVKCICPTTAGETVALSLLLEVREGAN